MEGGFVSGAAGREQQRTRGAGCRCKEGQPATSSQPTTPCGPTSPTHPRRSGSWKEGAAVAFAAAMSSRLAAHMRDSTSDISGPPAGGIDQGRKEAAQLMCATLERSASTASARQTRPPRKASPELLDTGGNPEGNPAHLPRGAPLPGAPPPPRHAPPAGARRPSRPAAWQTARWWWLHGGGEDTGGRVGLGAGCDRGSCVRVQTQAAFQAARAPTPCKPACQRPPAMTATLCMTRASMASRTTASWPPSSARRAAPTASDTSGVADRSSTQRSCAMASICGRRSRWGGGEGSAAGCRRRARQQATLSGQAPCLLCEHQTYTTVSPPPSPAPTATAKWRSASPALPVCRRIRRSTQRAPKSGSAGAQRAASSRPSTGASTCVGGGSQKGEWCWKCRVLQGGQLSDMQALPTAINHDSPQAPFPPLPLNNTWHTAAPSAHPPTHLPTQQADVVVGPGGQGGQQAGRHLRLPALPHGPLEQCPCGSGEGGVAGQAGAAQALLRLVGEGEGGR